MVSSIANQRKFNPSEEMKIYPNLHCRNLQRIINWWKPDNSGNKIIMWLFVPK